MRHLHAIISSETDQNKTSSVDLPKKQKILLFGLNLSLLLIYLLRGIEDDGMKSVNNCKLYV